MREVREGDYVYLSEKYPRELVGKEHNSSKGLIGLNCARLWVAEGKARILDETVCELCGGTGIISQEDDDIATHVHFGSVSCECTKTEEESR